MRIIIYPKPGGKDPLPKEFEFGYVTGEMSGKLAVVAATPPKMGKVTLPSMDEASGIALVSKDSVLSEFEVADDAIAEAVTRGTALLNVYEDAAGQAAVEAQAALRIAYFDRLRAAAGGEATTSQD